MSNGVYLGSTQRSSDNDMDDEVMIFSLTDIGHDADVEDCGDSRNSESSGDEHSASKRAHELPKAAVSLRQRRRSKLGIEGEFSKLNLNLAKTTLRYQSNDSGFDEGHSEGTPNSTSVGSPKITARWLKAFRKIKTIKDPWENFHIENLQEETCTRYRYNAMRKEWRTDTVKVKMEDQVIDIARSVYG